MSDRLIYFFLGLFGLAALVVPLLPIVLARFIAPKRPGKVKQQPYECGMEVEGDAWIQFRMHYYLFAILFVIFDVEALFLFPWAVIFNRDIAAVIFYEMLVFMGILFFGLIYAWKKGVLQWK